MRALHPAALLVTVGALALAGCGGSDGDEAAVSVPDAAPSATTTAPAATTPTEVTSTATAPAATETTTSTTTTVAPPDTTTPTTATEPESGGTAPPSSATPKPAAPSVDGDRPTITARANGVARTTAGDAGQAEVWCDNARQGSYDELLGDVTTLVITVRGSDATQRCELPR